MFAQAIAQYFGPITVACSGGADSLALAHATAVYAKKNALAMPHWVYVNHGLRDEAESEGAHIAQIAKGIGASFEECRVQVSTKGSLEARAREARYSALQKAATIAGAKWVLLGHTSSDQSETVFMRIFRGTGLVGLAGMPRERGIFARPLLGFRRQDTEAYCRTHSLDFIEDTMNRDEQFTRVRIRHHWLPELRKENPKVDGALLRLAESARDHREVLDWAAKAVLQEHRHTDGSLDVGEVWKSYPDSLAKRALALHFGSGEGGELEALHLEDLLAMARGEIAQSGQLSLPGATVIREYEIMRVVGAGLEEHSPIVDRASVPEGYELRVWCPGDRMRPVRLKGRSRKLSDLFADAKVPRSRRISAQIVLRQEDQCIVWAQYIGHSFDASIRISSLPEK